MHEQPLPDAIKQALMHGDLSELTPEQQLLLYHQTCVSLGLNPLTNPFHYLWLKGEGDKKRLVLYATKGCADQLRNIHGITEQIVSRVIEDGLCIVTARSSDASGRYDEDLGIVPVAKEVGDWKISTGGKRYFQGEGIFTKFDGEILANAIKKAITQAKRRSTLSFCGLGMLDESEIEGIPGAVTQDPPTRDTTQRPAHTALPPSDAVEIPRTSTQEPEKVLAAPFVDASSTASPVTTLGNALPKPTIPEIAQLMNLLQQVYQDAGEVHQRVRTVLAIPSNQECSDFRIRATMTGAHVKTLEDDATAYALAKALPDDDVPIFDGPEPSTLPQAERSDPDEGGEAF